WVCQNTPSFPCRASRSRRDWIARLTPRYWWFLATIFAVVPLLSSNTMEVLKQVPKSLLVPHAFEERLHVHDAGFFLVKALPFVEVLELARDAPELRFVPVPEDDDRVVVQDVRDRVPVVAEIVVVRAPEVFVDVL